MGTRGLYPGPDMKGSKGNNFFQHGNFKSKLTHIVVTPLMVIATISTAPNFTGVFIGNVDHAALDEKAAAHVQIHGTSKSYRVVWDWKKYPALPLPCYCTYRVDYRKKNDPVEKHGVKKTFLGATAPSPPN